MNTKTCHKCGRDLPASSKYFYKDRTKPDGWNWRCKRCVAEQRGTAFVEPSPDVPHGQKWCRSCKQAKPYREFHRQTKSKDGHNGTCKECRSKNEGFGYKPAAPKGFKYCRKCKNKLLATTDYFYIDNSQKSGLSSWCMGCVSKGVKEWRTSNPKRVNEYRKRWLGKNPGAKKIFADRRRAMVSGLKQDFTKEDWQHALDHFGGRCAVCDRPPGFWHTLAMDHWIPVSAPDCPGTIPGNIIPLCHGRDGCNNSKSGKNPGEWLIEKYGKRRANQILKKINEYISAVS